MLKIKDKRKGLKMKVIDLLNKIANKEEVPKKIEVFGYTFFRYEDEWSHFYYYATADKEDELMEQLNSTNDLNDEVEIIEEEKEISKITMRAGLVGSIENKIVNLDINIMAVEDKINELIDVVNELKKENKQ
jgi:hypothetical protein